MAKELEIKILDVNVDEVKKKLKHIGAEFVEEGMQDLYTYDLLPLHSRYLALLDSINYDPDTHRTVRRFLNLAKEIDTVLNQNAKDSLRTITGYYTFHELVIENKDNEDLFSILSSEKLLTIIKNCQDKLKKWVRLRKSPNKIELTIKQILSEDDEYDVSDVDEYEINVSDYDMTNTLLHQLGFVVSYRQQKYRTSYKYKNCEIEIDKWPLIKPYLEIEGKSEDEIYELVEALGYTKADVKIMNTTEVYKLYNINLYDYYDLIFDLEEDE